MLGCDSFNGETEQNFNDTGDGVQDNSSRVSDMEIQNL